MSESNRITAQSKVADVISKYPELETEFLEFGFKNILNPVMRRTVARKMTIEMGCRMRDVDLEAFLVALNSALKKQEK